MICEKCEVEMNWSIDGSTQGMRCPLCGSWGLVTSYIDEIYVDDTEYSLYLRKGAEINKEKVMFVAKIAKVNFVVAKQMLEEKEVCILKAKAPEIKAVIVKLQDLGIDFITSPLFKY